MDYEDDDPPLGGEYLRAICRALTRNRVAGLKSASVVPDGSELLELPKKVQRVPANYQERKSRDAAYSKL
jgi:hypothetical protein